MQLRVSVTIDIVVSIGFGISTLLSNLKEALMNTVNAMRGVLAGAALVWRSGDDSIFTRDR